MFLYEFTPLPGYYHNSKEHFLFVLHMLIKLTRFLKQGGFTGYVAE